MKAEDIKKRRKALGWSQSELGLKIGIPTASSATVLISKYETSADLSGIASEERLKAIEKALSDEEQLRRDFEAFKAGRASK